MAKVYSSARNDSQSFIENSISSASRSKENLINIKQNALLAPHFKYQYNSPIQDIEAIRRLITLERHKQDEKENHFWKSDYERMMRDDWLVSRFLLRGRKVTLAANITKEIDEASKKEEYSTIQLNALELIKSCAKFKRNYNINATTKLSEFPIEWTIKGGLFNYKPDLVGNPVMYLRVKLHKPKLIESQDLRFQFKRLLLHTLERCDQDLINDPGKGICCVFDMSGATFENVDLELLSWMIKSFKNFSPKLLCYVIVYNLPWFFSATFKLISNTLMSNSNRQSLKFVYGTEILNFIAENNLPQYITESL